MIIKYIFPVLSIILICTSTMVAQQTTQKDTSIKVNQVEVIKEFEVTLEEANKIRIIPQIPIVKPIERKYDYDVTIVPIQLNYPPTEIRPLAMDPDDPFTINRGYLNAGYGTLKTTLFEAGYQFTKDEQYNLLLNTNYHALNNEKNNPYQKYSSFSVGANGDYFLKENMKVFGGVNGKFDNRNFFHTHLGVDTLYSASQSERKIKDIGLNIGIFNPERSIGNLNYRTELLLQNVSFSDQGNSESRVGLHANLEKHRSANTLFALDSKFEYFTLNTDPSASIFNVHIIPKIVLHFKKLRISAGANLFYDKNTIAPFPDIDISYAVVNNNVQVFSGVTQNYYTNGLTNQYQINPFMSSEIPDLRNNVFKDIYAGIKGEFSFISYQVQAGYKISDSHAFFVSDSLDFRKFNQVFDDVSIYYISGNIDFKLTPQINLGGWLTQNLFNLDKLEKAWHQPRLQANAYAKFTTFNDKLRLRGELFLSDRVDFQNFEGNTVQSNLLFDFNTVVEFFPLRNAGIFLKAHNILNNKYERWYGYPTVGINLQAGISLIF